MRRQQWVKWVQLVTVLVWSLFPPFYSPVNAIWVPSAADPMVPVWEGDGEPAQNPAMMDSDGDGLSDWLEQYLETSPGNPDSDYDGLSDSFELWTSNTSPLNWDSNSDGYYGSWNVHHHTAGFGVTVYDWDGDGFYNPNDSWPFDSNNGSVPVPWSDMDGDGIHDNADPYPSDPLNGSSPPLSSDMDLDGIPDSMDTHPNDAGRSSDHNNNGHNDWNDTPYNTDTDNDGHFDGNDTDPNNAALWNDQFPRNGINDQDEPPPSSGYDPMSIDSDGDGRMDHADSHPGDASRWSDLNNNGFNDWEDTPYNMDRDNDGHFDGNDSDPDNGTLWNDHSPRDGINDPVTPPLTGGDDSMIADSDSDGRVDHSDSHPNDSSRWSDWDNDVLNAEVEQGLGTSPYHWDTDSDGLSDGEEVQYQTNPLVADMDGDGLTDREELLGTFGSSPRDKFSLSRGRGWGETYTDWHLADLTDTDGDGIPDKIEDLYAPYLNKQNAADAEWDADADGFTNLQAYLNGWTLRATINSIDRDGDGIEDAVEDLYPGILDKFNFADAVEDPDGDDLMNWQEVELPLQGYHPGDAQSRYAGVADHTARAWVALSGEVGLYLLQGGDWSSYRHLSRLPEGNYNVQMSHWVTMVDSDGTGLPDGLEAFLRDVAVEHGFVPGRVNPGDYDGDGMPDVWEWRYRGQLNLLSPTDAGPFVSVMPAPPLEPDASQFDLYLQEGVEAYQAAMGNYGAAMNTRRIQDLDADGLSNLMEYLLSTHPLIADSDGDSLLDGVEYQYGGDPNNGNNLPTTLLEITGGSAQAAVVGAVSNSPLTVLAVRAGVPRGNYAVQFNTNGFGKLGPTMAGPWSTQLVSVTNDAGLASIYWQAPLAAGSGNLQVRGSDVGSAPQNISATAQPPTGGGDGPGPGDGTNPPNPGTSPVPVDPWEMVRIMERSRKVFVSRSSGGIPSGAIVISPNGTPTGYFLPRRIKSFDGQQEMNDFLEPLERLPSGHYVDRHGEHLIEDDLLNIPAVSAWAVTYGDLSETISPQTWFYGGGWSEGTDLSAPLSSSESVAATIAAGGIDAPLGSVLNELNMLLLPFAPADVNWRQLPVRSQAPYYCVEHPSGGVLRPAGLVLSLQSASGDEVGEEEGEQYQGRFLVGSKRLYWMARTRPLNANGDPDMAAELPELTQTWLRVVERVTDDFGNALPTTPALNANGNPNPGSSVEVLQMDTVTLVMPEDALTSTETRVNGVTVMVPPGTFPGSVLLSTGIIGTRVSLLPIDLTGHRRGTFNAPGAVSTGGTYGKETVLLENADRDEGSATQRDLDTATLDKANDDDLVKVVLSFPANTKPAGVGLKLKHEGMKVDGTKTTFDSAVVREGASRLNFYDDQGNKLTDADLKIDDLANPGSGYMAKIVTAGTLTLFIEGDDNFGMVGTSDQSETNAKYMGGALLTLEITGAGAAADSGPRLLVFRGGFFRYHQPDLQPGEIGTLEFCDGKGRITDTTTDYGSVIKSWSGRSGETTGGDYGVPDDNGHIPPGWRYIYKRSDFSTTQRNREEGTGNSMIVRQGNYCRWLQDDNAPGYATNYLYKQSIEGDRNIGKPSMPTTTSDSGQTVMFKFQTEVIPPNTSQRTEIQFHPDGKKDGTAGCIGIQSYDACKEVYRYLNDFKAMKLKVELGTP